MARRFVLASSSPRRRALLAESGYTFGVAPADVDETILPGEKPHLAVTRLAIEKALAARARDSESSDAVILAADTCVVCADQILGKPTSFDDAVRMLSLLSGRNHRVITGWAALRRFGPSELALTGAAISIVRMREIPMREAVAYACGPEPYDKAGAYAVQGDARQFISAVIGPLDNVIGLPLTPVREVLARFGVVPLTT